MTLKKSSSDLGFSLEGGVGSSSGDKPLTVQKIFRGKTSFSQFKAIIFNTSIFANVDYARKSGGKNVNMILLISKVRANCCLPHTFLLLASLLQFSTRGQF